MKTFFRLILLLPFFWLSFSQSQNSPPSVQWIKTVSGQYTSPFETVIKSVRDNLGSTYVLSNDFTNIYVVKYDASGSITRIFTYNNAYNGVEYAFDIKTDQNNNVIIAGSADVNYAQFPLVVKYDPNGNQLWEYVVNQPTSQYFNEVRSIALDGNDNIILSGVINDSAFYAKLNSSGSLLWKKMYAPSGYSTGAGNSVVTDNNGLIYGCGKVKNSAGNTDLFVTKMNNGGTILWNKLITGNTGADDEGKLIRVDNNYNCYVAGNIADTSATNKSVIITKLNSAGGQQWTKKLYQAGQSNQELADFTIDNMGNCFATARCSLQIGNPNVRTYKISTLGNMVWSNVYVNPLGLESTPNTITVNSIGNVYVAGSSQTAVSRELFVLAYSSSGISLLNTIYDYPATCIETPATVSTDNSGSIYIAFTLLFQNASKSDVALLKFNSSGQKQFESVYNAPWSAGSQGVKMIHENGKLFMLGTMQNEGSSEDMVVSVYDEQGNIEWQNVVDDGQFKNLAYDMEKSGNNLYLLGSDHTNGYGTMLVKYDAIGSPLWTDTIINHIYNTLEISANGNIVSAGSSGPGENHKDFRLCFHNATTGARIFESSPAHQPNFITNVKDMKTDAASNIYVLGDFRYIDPVNYLNNYIKIRLQKFNASGSLLWTADLNGIDSAFNAMAEATKLKIDANGTVFVLASGVDLTNSLRATLLAAYSASGVQLWYKKMTNGISSESARDMVGETDTLLYLLSQQQNASDFSIRKVGKTNGQEYMTVHKSIALQTGISMRLAQDSIKNLYVCAQAYETAPYSDPIIHICKLDTLANIIWEKSFDGERRGSDYPNQIIAEGDGRIYLLATAIMEDFGINPSITVIKFCDIPEPLIASSGATAGICPGNSVTLTASGGVSFLWNNLVSSAPSIVTDSSSAYYCQVFQQDGCFKYTDTLNVSLKAIPSAPEICLVTVDTLSNHNILYWDKSGDTGVNHYNIYREDVTNVYSFIGIVPYDSLSEFHDTVANPNVTTKRYKISAVDSCGQESPLSSFHNTIYIVDNGGGQYSWNPLYTIENSANPVNNYVLMRDDLSNNNWQQVSITAGTQNTIVDPSYNSFPQARWRVETIWNISCDPTRAIVNTSRSNIKNSVNNPTLGLNEITISSAGFSPNPFSANTQLLLAGANEKSVFVLELFDETGRLVRTENFSGLRFTLERQMLADGIYFYRVTDKLSGKYTNGKLVITH